MNAAHTPWTLRDDLRIVDAQGAPIALAATAEHGGLIAAAPELLAALIRLSNAAFARDTTMGDQCALFAAQAELRDATKIARAAIAKATGAAA